MNLGDGGNAFQLVTNQPMAVQAYTSRHQQAGIHRDESGELLISSLLEYIDENDDENSHSQSQLQVQVQDNDEDNDNDNDEDKNSENSKRGNQGPSSR